MAKKPLSDNRHFGVFFIHSYLLADYAYEE